MKVKTKHLSKLALNWAVSLCEHPEWSHENRISNVKFARKLGAHDWINNAALIVDILDRESISVGKKPNDTNGTCVAHHLSSGSYVTGSSVSIAVLRCYVCARLGEEVEIPAELLPNTVRWKRFSGNTDVCAYRPEKGWFAEHVLLDASPLTGQRFPEAQWWIKEIVQPVMKNYLVLYRIQAMTIPVEEPLGYQCWAEDADHAEEMCRRAHHNCSVLWACECAVDTTTQQVVQMYYASERKQAPKVHPEIMSARIKAGYGLV